MESKSSGARSDRVGLQSYQQLTLANGRHLILDSIDQWRTYADVLEGVPTRENNERRILDVVTIARQKDDREPLLLPPVQRPLDSWHPLGEPAELPAICCVARLFSLHPARDPAMHCSSLTLIWYQDDYAFPLSEEAARALHHLDWTRFAHDGVY